MIRRRSFLAAVLAAAAAPAFVRKLACPIYVPSDAIELPEWLDRRGVAFAELVTQDGPILRQAFGFSKGSLDLSGLDFTMTHAAIVTGLKITAGADVRDMPFDSGPKFAISADRILTTTRLAHPLGAIG